MCLNLFELGAARSGPSTKPTELQLQPGQGCCCSVRQQLQLLTCWDAGVWAERIDAMAGLAVLPSPPSRTVQMPIVLLATKA